MLRPINYFCTPCRYSFSFRLSVCSLYTRDGNWVTNGPEYVFLGSAKHFPDKYDVATTICRAVAMTHDVTSAATISPSSRLTSHNVRRTSRFNWFRNRRRSRSTIRVLNDVIRQRPSSAKHLTISVRGDRCLRRFLLTLETVRRYGAQCTVGNGTLRHDEFITRRKFGGTRWIIILSTTVTLTDNISGRNFENIEGNMPYTHKTLTFIFWVGIAEPGLPARGDYVIVAEALSQVSQVSHCCE